MGLRANGNNPTKQELKEAMTEMGIKKGNCEFRVQTKRKKLSIYQPVTYGKHSVQLCLLILVEEDGHS